MLRDIMTIVFVETHQILKSHRGLSSNKFLVVFQLSKRMEQVVV
jgi:hypothetical protein